MATKRKFKVPDVKTMVSLGVGAGMLIVLWKIFGEDKPRKLRVHMKNVRDGEGVDREAGKAYATNDLPFGGVKGEKWFPADLAGGLFKCMEGISLLFTCSEWWEEITRLNDDEVRYLHNYWLQNIDPKIGIYDWVAGEAKDLYGIKQEALLRMTEAGLRPGMSQIMAYVS